jgi:hypothetical protein
MSGKSKFIVWAHSSRHTPAVPDYVVVDMVEAMREEGYWTYIRGKQVYVKGAWDRAVEATGRPRNELELAPIGQMRFTSTSGYIKSESAI